MKKKRNLIFLVAVVMLLILTGSNFSRSLTKHTSFSSARQSGEEVHIVGEWVRKGEANYLDDSDVFLFYLKDKKDKIDCVVFNDPMPVNFAEASQLIVVGSYSGSMFVANRIIVEQLPQPADAKVIEHVAFK